MATSILGEEPRFGTTPLAMLAATCNKIGNTSPLTTLPESSAFAKGGFHPWKRSSSSCNLGSSLSGFAVATGGRGSGGLAGGSGAANSAFCLASTSPTSSAFSSDYGGLFSNSAAAAAAAAGVSPQEAGGQSAFISKVHTTAADGLYPRVGMAHPYESWYKSGFHSTLAAGEVTNGAASSWWDVHSSPGSWLEVQNPAGGLQSSLHSGAPQASLHSQLGTYNPDFSSLTHSAFSSTGLGSSAAAASHLLSTSQHLLAQDGFKPVLPSYSDSSAAVAAAAASAMISGAAAAAAGGSSARSARRYSGRATCDCPNCQEAERLGLPPHPPLLGQVWSSAEAGRGVFVLGPLGRGAWSPRGCPARLGVRAGGAGGEGVVGFPEERGRRGVCPSQLCFSWIIKADQRAWRCRSRWPRRSLRSPVIKASARCLCPAGQRTSITSAPGNRGRLPGPERPAGRTALAEPEPGGSGALSPS
ncbi:PREDICTED: transcription factor Sp9 [Hipposideros armiger]|uniref:Transcription factor Sp9 n=1 Tax=Hipposideros armiger TaxID=186990 RepID=A0A8B7S7F0_HIPAR|nr:PREDICTED: transcription factor Sp9 [Hipposideros armiger]